MTFALGLFGFLTVIFFLLASFNALKRYINHPIIQKIASNHKIFGMLASLMALVHMLLAVVNGNLRITGALALIALIVTGMMGMMYSTQRSKPFYIAHRIMGPLTLVLIVLHIIFNSSF
jgi:hypothetical protein